ncbi:MAG: restriction system-associated AAA family ATPase [Cocleimonas sp.]
MKLLSLKIIKSASCDGLLDGLFIPFRDVGSKFNLFNPICLIGPNGTGKSQVLQSIAEIFQFVYSSVVPDEEKGKPNKELEFEIKYLISNELNNEIQVKISHTKVGRSKKLIIETYNDGEWNNVDVLGAISLLPSKVIAYTSGDNETLSIPFFVSREGYANAVAISAKNGTASPIEPRLMLVDYETNLEVLISNLLLNNAGIRQQLLGEVNLKSLHSFRCIIQLDHTEAPSGGIRLTSELEEIIENLVRCSTTHDIDEQKKVYTLDFLVSDATHRAFNNFWPDGALDLYSSFHKLAMLNNLIIPKAARTSFNSSIKTRNFATRLPEPFITHKAFRFEQVQFNSDKSDKPVDYVSLSDGEHQLAQILGTMCMASSKNTLFLLDEPESHFNPKWRIEFISKLLTMGTVNGVRAEMQESSMQECLLTTHSPFVPSDMKRENVLVFNKNNGDGTVHTRRPSIETFGATFDTILEECFKINPAMSAIPKAEIDRLLSSDNIEEITIALQGLGDSVERLYLADRVRSLRSQVEVQSD